MGTLLRILAYAAGLAAASWLLEGIRFNGATEGSAEVQAKVLPVLAVAAILALINTAIRPVLLVVSFPITILTLGLFPLVINGLMLLLANKVADAFDLGFWVSGFWSAFFGAIIITVVGMVVDAIFGTE